eukprot:scaffold14810_cov101-Isochrysis_galbana.AAC.1
MPVGGDGRTAAHRGAPPCRLAGGCGVGVVPGPVKAVGLAGVARAPAGRRRVARQGGRRVNAQPALAGPIIPAAVRPIDETAGPDARAHLAGPLGERVRAGFAVGHALGADGPPTRPPRRLVREVALVVGVRLAAGHRARQHVAGGPGGAAAGAVVRALQSPAPGDGRTHLPGRLCGLLIRKVKVVRVDVVRLEQSLPLGPEPGRALDLQPAFGGPVERLLRVPCRVHRSTGPLLTVRSQSGARAHPRGSARRR